jgi:hypothetical protein
MAARSSARCHGDHVIDPDAAMLLAGGLTFAAVFPAP